jgi:hypothetical protein
VIASVAPGRRLLVERGLIWLAKYGIVRIHPASS